MTANYILSFPRSGSTLLRGFCEYLTDKPTVGVVLSEERKKTDPTHNDPPIIETLRHKLEERDYKNLIYKAHEPNDIIRECDNLVMIYRNPYDCIFSHMCRAGGFTTVDPVSGNSYIDTTKFVGGSVKNYVDFLVRWFGGNLDYIFSRFYENKPTKVISFNKLIEDPYNMAKTVIKFFNERVTGEAKENKNSPENISNLIQYCRTFYEYRYPPLNAVQKNYLETFKPLCSEMVNNLISDKITKIQTLLD